MLGTLIILFQISSTGVITGFKRINHNYRIDNGINMVSERYGKIIRKMAELNRNYSYDKYPAIERFRRYAKTNNKQPVVIRLLVLRVEFQKEQPDDPKSTGDGTFIMTSNGEPMILGTDCEGNPLYNPFYDPPHDWNYFNTLTEALANYYEAATYGKVRIEWVVKPDSGLPPYKVPHTMGYYSGWGEDPELGLVTFIRDAFIAADRDSSINFEDLDNNGVKDYTEGVFDRYVIFHPGSAWQTDLNMDSPYDMPAVTVPSGAIEYYLQVPYILLNSGRDTVFDAEVMSETMSQDGIDVRINGTFFHESGHNMFFYPDLYDTKYNGSGVGAFGIMTTGPYLSAEGIPSGVLPPYPNAWTRLWTDWIMKYMFGEGFVDSRILKEKAASEVKDTTVLLPVSVGVDSFALKRNGILYYTQPYFHEDPHRGIRFLKVPVNSHEYFLFENLKTDLAFNDTIVCGDTARVFAKWKNGVLVHFFGENDYLEPADGILAWHVDDKIYWENYAYNEVNAVRPMAVDVVEADHVQDFEKWTDISPYAYTWFGCPYDTYFKGNNTLLSPWTTPSSNDNENNKTDLIFEMPDTVCEKMRVITQLSGDMSGFPLRIGHSIIDSSINFKKYTVPVKSLMEFDSVFGVVQYLYVDSLDLVNLDTASIDSFLLFSVLNKAGNVIFTDTIRHSHTISSPTIFKENDTVFIVFPTLEGTLHFYTYSNDSVINTWNRYIGNEMRGTVSMGYYKDTLFVFAGAEDQKLHLIDTNGNEHKTFDFTAPVRNGVGLLNNLIFAGGTDGVISIMDDRGNFQRIGHSYPSPYNSPFIATKFPDTMVSFVSIKGDGKAEATGFTGNTLWRKNTEGNPSPYIATGHCGDGLFFAYTLNKELYALNTRGSYLSGFPLNLPDSNIGGIITADVNSDGNDEIIIATGEHLDAFDIYGREVKDFPLPGSQNVQNPVLDDFDDDTYFELAYITDDGYLFVNDMNVKNASQKRSFGDAAHDLFLNALPTQASPANKGVGLIYIYPNPVKNGTATLRFRVTSSGKGRIDFVNYSGRLAKSQYFVFHGNTTEEISLDLSGLEPDMYYLDVHFNGENTTEEKIIKMFLISQGAKK